MNYIIYGKHKTDKRYGAMDIKSGSIGVGLLYATLIPDLDRAKGYVDQLADNTTDYSFQVRGAGSSKIFYTRGLGLEGSSFV